MVREAASRRPVERAQERREGRERERERVSERERERERERVRAREGGREREVLCGHPCQPGDGHFAKNFRFVCTR